MRRIDRIYDATVGTLLAVTVGFLLCDSETEGGTLLCLVLFAAGWVAWGVVRGVAAARDVRVWNQRRLSRNQWRTDLWRS